MANYVTYTTTVKLNTKEAQNQLEELKRKVEDLKQKRDYIIGYYVCDWFFPIINTPLWQSAGDE